MSDKTKHTPGEWQVEDRTVYCLDSLERVNRFTAHVDGYLCTMEELRANARLMGAAPDLLSACREALRCISGYQRYSIGESILKEAIAKATGIKED